ncbi:sulfur carrier protein ThiS [uncultured Duncaniella sp.]|uniref:sulfur carrier protein ThiS n=1 Tax=uncultured Duncaniella sp. TaxID=2768039 RepID=UPI0026EF75C5|nr:sulfur carrier protein ThiS [uncultured Duncaniella sp.]
MNIVINNQKVELADKIINVADLLTERNIPLGGTAVAVNNHLITRMNWNMTFIKDGDVVTIISAAFGG